MNSELSSDLAEGSDGLPVRLVGEWCREKLFYVQRYDQVFNTSMKRKWSTRIYIDLFCGPGRNRIRQRDEEIDGSPLLAVKQPDTFTHHFFNDINAQAVEALKKRLHSYELKNPGYFTRDCNEAAALIARSVPPQALGLAFIDPTNWQVHFRSVEELTSNRRIDLILTFHTGSMKRVPADYVDTMPENLATEDEPLEEAAPEVLTALDLFLGDKGWRSEYENARRSGAKRTSRALLDYYESKLQRIGYLYANDEVLVRNSKNVPLYHLVFASKHPRGGDLWRKISRRTSSGQGRLFAV